MLANEATALMHGREAAGLAAETARKTFEEGVTGRQPADRGRGSRRVRGAGLGVLTAFVQAGLTPSTGEARRQIKGGGLRLNDVALTDERYMLSDKDFVEGFAKLSVGRKKHVLLKVE